MIFFNDRRDAGCQLAARLEYLKGHTDVLVLGIPRGGIVVADEIARALDAPLDIFLTHKLGAPANPELAIGAVASDGTTFLDPQRIRELHLSSRAVEREKAIQVHEIQRREELYRHGQPPYDINNKTVILSDDGIATGATTITALRALAHCHPAERILAVPVAPLQTARLLMRECEELVLLDTPEPFLAVGRFYYEFEQVSDEQVMDILSAARQRQTEGENG